MEVPLQAELAREKPGSRQDTVKHNLQHNVRKGMVRKDRQSGVSTEPKKSGKGGKYTWEGPDPTIDAAELTAEEEAPVAIDENDPNYIDEECEKVDREVAAGVIEVPKVAAQH